MPTAVVYTHNPSIREAEMGKLQAWPGGDTLS